MSAVWSPSRSRHSGRSPYVDAWLAEMDARPPFARDARHIRGRVFAIRGRRTSFGDQMFGMEVVNTLTGKVLIDDNCADYQRLVASCHEATAVARGAWFYSLRKRDVTTKPGAPS